MVGCAEVSVVVPPEKRKPDGQVCDLCQAFETAQVSHHACLAHL